MSGPGILPVALRALYECADAFPDAALVGVGGVRSGRDAVAMVMAGAHAVEVGTATFADPRAPWRVAREARRMAHAPRSRQRRGTDWCRSWLRDSEPGCAIA